MTPSAISHYLLMEELTSDRTGVIYRAKDERSGRVVMLKLLPSSPPINHVDREKFLREVRIASSLHHPNISEIYGIGEEGDRRFVVMEPVEGKALKDLIRGNPLSVNQILKVGIQVAQGLSAAHSAGVVHRDIRPENILVTDQGQAKIVDFGFAMSLDDPKAGKFPRVAGGTFEYAGPEKVSESAMGIQSDVYSLGAVLYEMATGNPPFAEEFKTGSSEKLLDAILRRKPTPTRRVNRNVPPGLEAVILKSLEKKPEDRFQSMNEVATQLAAVQTQMRDGWLTVDDAMVKHSSGSGTIRVESPRAGTAVFGRAFRRNFAASVLMMMVVIVVAGLFAFRGTPLGFGMAFGAAVLGYESYLLLRASKPKSQPSGLLHDPTE